MMGVSYCLAIYIQDLESIDLESLVYKLSPFHVGVFGVVEYGVSLR